MFDWFNRHLSLAGLIGWLSAHFPPVHGMAWWGWVAGSLAASALLFVVLNMLPPRLRRPMILGTTFIGGLYFALEFFWGVRSQPIPGAPDHLGNWLTPGILPFGNISPVIGGFTVGLGVINLFQIHGRRISRGGENAFYSGVFFLSTIVMFVSTILQKAHPNSINLNFYSLLFDGLLQNLSATMFSIIAFYIVSAAYRAFRARSVEATLLLVTAVVVMIGQIALGQMLTNGISHTGFWANVHVEVVRNWILTQANAAATRAIQFGLGVGLLAVALRIWLGLERGSYFDTQG